MLQVSLRITTTIYNSAKSLLDVATMLKTAAIAMRWLKSIIDVPRSIASWMQKVSNTVLHWWTKRVLCTMQSVSTKQLNASCKHSRWSCWRSLTATKMVESSLVDTLIASKRFDDAQRYAAQACEIHEATRHGSESIKCAEIALTLGNIAANQARTADALLQYTKALTIRRLKQHKVVQRNDEEKALILSSIGNLLQPIDSTKQSSHTRRVSPFVDVSLAAATIICRALGYCRTLVVHCMPKASSMNPSRFNANRWTYSTKYLILLHHRRRRRKTNIESDRNRCCNNQLNWNNIEIRKSLELFENSIILKKEYLKYKIRSIS